MPTTNPIYTAVPDNQRVDKVPFRQAWSNFAYSLENVAALQDHDGRGQKLIFVGQKLFKYDASDTTTADDGINCVHDNTGKRYKLQPTEGVAEHIAAVNPHPQYRRKFGNLVHANDYANLALAVDALPAEGGTVELGVGSYVSPWNSIANRMLRKNIRIVGQGVPDYNHRTAPTALQGGSIIKGFAAFDADNLTIEGLGFDVGADWCNTNFAGVAQEGVWLALPTIAGGVRRYGLHMRDFSILAHQNNSAIHSLLANNVQDGEVVRAKSRLGGDGFVFFVEDMDIQGLDCAGHATYSVLLKATNDGTLRGVTVSGVTMKNLAVANPTFSNLAQYDTTGFVIEAAEADARGVSISHIHAHGVLLPLRLQGSAGWTVRDTVIDGLIAQNSAQNPMRAYVNVARVRLSNFITRNSGNSIAIDAGCSDITLSDGRIEGANNYAIDNSGTNTRIIACEQTGNVVGGANGGLRNLAGSARIEASQGFSAPVIIGGTVTVGGTSPGIVDNASSPYLQLDSVVGRGAINGVSYNNAHLTVNKDDGRDGLNIVTTGTAVQIMQRFVNNNGVVGSVSISGSAAAFNTSSDYRLKENVQAMDGTASIERVLQLKPSSYTFISDGSAGEGFIAHELQSFVPLAVSGEKDAVDVNEKIIAQQVDLSKLVPLLVAAVQELARKK